MFTQCPECKTVFGFSEEHLQVARGRVRCSQCSHVFEAMAHVMDELPGNKTNQPPEETTTESTLPTETENPVSEAEPETELHAEASTATQEPDTTSSEADDDAFSLFDEANDFMEAISDDFQRPEPAVEESIVFNELGDTTKPATPVSDDKNKTDMASPGPSKSTIEAAMEEESIATSIEAETTSEVETEPAPEEVTQENVPPETVTETAEVTEPETTEPVEQTTEDEADKMASEWATMLEEEEQAEPSQDVEPESVAEEPNPEEISQEADTDAEPVELTEENADKVAEEWAAMLEEEDQATASTDAEPVTEETVLEEEPLDASSESEETTDTEPVGETVEAEPEEENDGLNENSSLQDFLQSQLEDFDDAPASTKHGAEEAEALDISLDSLTEQSLEKPVEEPVEEKITADQVAEDTTAIDDFIPSEDKTPSWGIQLVWVFGILTSLLLLTSQYIYTMRDDLSQIASARPWVIKFCEITECKVPLYSNLDQLEFVSQDVRSHPNYQNALMVTIVFINKSPFYQAYPVIQFQLSDIDQSPVAGRYFLPVAYLDSTVDIKEGIKPDVPIRAVIEINDPGARAINYDFDFK